MRAAISPKRIPKTTVAIRLTAAKRCRNERPDDSSDRPAPSNALASGHPRGSIQHLTGRENRLQRQRGGGCADPSGVDAAPLDADDLEIAEATEVRGMHTPIAGGCLGASEECDDNANVRWSLATAPMSLAQPAGHRQGKMGSASSRRREHPH